jgi:hypothetical protein
MRLLTPIQTRLQASPAALRAVRWLLIALVAFVPGIVSYVMVSARANPANFVPVWNDEVSYWHQTLTFIHAGFEGGYYTSYHEGTPAAEFTHFYTHGPWYPMLYGTIARVTGWGLGSALFTNVLLVALALAALCIAARFTIRQLIVTGLLVASFWPLMFYLFTNMQEALQQALGILLALAFYAALTQRERLKLGYKVAIFALIFFAAVTRLSWGIFFLPFFLLAGRKSWLGYLLALPAAGVATVAAMLIANAVGAPGNNSIFAVLDGFSISLSAGFEGLWRYLSENVTRYFAPDKYPLDAWLTVQIIVLVVALLGIAAVQVWRDRAALVETAFHAFNVVGIVLACWLLYIIATMGDYRIIGAHLLVTALVMVAMKRERLVALLIISNLLFVPEFVRLYNAAIIDRKFQVSAQPISDFRALVEPHLIFDADAGSPWCNTVLFYVRDYNNLFTAVPAGFGLSFYADPVDPKLPYKSRYVLLNDDFYGRLEQRAEQPDLEFLVATPNGSLYLNHSSACEQPAS